MFLYSTTEQVGVFKQTKELFDKPGRKGKQGYIY